MEILRMVCEAIYFCSYFWYTVYKKFEKENRNIWTYDLHKCTCRIQDNRCIRLVSSDVSGLKVKKPKTVFWSSKAQLGFVNELEKTFFQEHNTTSQCMRIWKKVKTIFLLTKNIFHNKTNYTHIYIFKLEWLIHGNLTNKA